VKVENVTPKQPGKDQGQACVRTIIGEWSTRADTQQYPQQRGNLEPSTRAHAREGFVARRYDSSQTLTRVRARGRTASPMSTALRLHFRRARIPGLL
jgi:hypothetical protein